MRKITLDSLVRLVSDNKWQPEMSFLIKEMSTGPGRKWCEIGRFYKIVEQTHMWGYAQKISKCADITILYTESFFYTENESSSLITTTEEVDNVWSLEGVIVTDGDNKVPPNVWSRYLPSSFSSVDYSQLDVNSAMDVSGEILM